jgi:hypothetical protein
MGLVRWPHWLRLNCDFFLFRLREFFPEEAFQLMIVLGEGFQLFNLFIAPLMYRLELIDYRGESFVCGHQLQLDELELVLIG